MKIKVHRKLPKSQIYPCLPKDIKAQGFGQIESFHATFGLTAEFSFNNEDRYRYKFPAIQGQVVAYANVMSVDRYKKLANYDPYNMLSVLTVCTLYIYPVKTMDYPEIALGDFRENVLPYISAWLIEQTGVSDSARLLDQKLIIEWAGDKHLIHKIAAK